MRKVTQIKMPLYEIVECFEKYYNYEKQTKMLRNLGIRPNSSSDCDIKTLKKIFDIPVNEGDICKCTSSSITTIPHISTKLFLIEVNDDAYKKLEKDLYTFISYDYITEGPESPKFSYVHYIVQFLSEEKDNPDSPHFDDNHFLTVMHDCIYYFLSNMQLVIEFPDSTAVIYTILFCLENFNTADPIEMMKKVITLSLYYDYLVSDGLPCPESISDKLIKDIIALVMKYQSSDLEYADLYRLLIDVDKCYSNALDKKYE